MTDKEKQLKSLLELKNHIIDICNYYNSNYDLIDIECVDCIDVKCNMCPLTTKQGECFKSMIADINYKYRQEIKNGKY